MVESETFFRPMTELSMISEETALAVVAMAGSHGYGVMVRHEKENYSLYRVTVFCPEDYGEGPLPWGMAPRDMIERIGSMVKEDSR